MTPWATGGDNYSIDWAGRTWSIRPTSPLAGLRCDDSGAGPLLSLAGLAEPGRTSTDALNEQSLDSVEQHFGRLSATYRPRDWGALVVKASWWQFAPDSIDLEVEVTARSVGRLRRLELLVLSAPSGLAEVPSARIVIPRDARAAMLSYDGRETDLGRLTTEPLGLPPAPWLVPRTPITGMTYLEMAHPHDVNRRIHEGVLPAAAMRYALFGHDLERGVVLRGRLRGSWLPKLSAYSQAETRWHDFLNQPPNLTR